MNTTYTDMIAAAIQNAADDFEANRLCHALSYSRNLLEKAHDAFKRLAVRRGYVGAHELLTRAIATTTEPPDESTCTRLEMIMTDLSAIIYREFRQGSTARFDTPTTEMLVDFEAVASACAEADV